LLLVPLLLEIGECDGGGGRCDGREMAVVTVAVVVVERRSWLALRESDIGSRLGSMGGFSS